MITYTYSTQSYLLEMSQYAVPAHIAQVETAKIVVTATPKDTPATKSLDFVIIAKAINGLSACTKMSVSTAAKVS